MMWELHMLFSKDTPYGAFWQRFCPEPEVQTCTQALQHAMLARHLPAFMQLSPKVPSCHLFVHIVLCVEGDSLQHVTQYSLFMCNHCPVYINEIAYSITRVPLQVY